MEFQTFTSSVYFTICINFTDLLLCLLENESQNSRAIGGMGLAPMMAEKLNIRNSWQEAFNLAVPS